MRLHSCCDSLLSPTISEQANKHPLALLPVQVLPRSHGEVRHQSTLVFVSTKHHVEFLHTLLEADGIQAACVYGSMDQVRHGRGVHESTVQH